MSFVRKLYDALHIKEHMFATTISLRGHHPPYGQCFESDRIITYIYY
jgi:hypothetical protein